MPRLRTTTPKTCPSVCTVRCLATASAVLRSSHGYLVAAGGRALVSVQRPIRLDPRSAPDPDFTSLRPRADFYGTGERPWPVDIPLLIEM